MKQNSEFGKIKAVDLLNALYYFIGTFLFGLIGYFMISKLPTLEQLLPILGTSLSPALLSIFKSFAKNSNGEIMKKE